MRIRDIHNVDIMMVESNGGDDHKMMSNIQSVSNTSGLGRFCGGDFWDLDLLVNSSYPHFTPCMATALVWAPCAVLWLCAPLYMMVVLWCRGGEARKGDDDAQYKGSNFNNGGSRQRTAGRRRPVSMLFCVKMAASVLLALVCTGSLVYRVLNDTFVPMVTIVSESVQIASFLLVAMVIHVERRHGVISSGLLFIVFLLFVCAGAVPLYTGVIQFQDKTVLEFALMCAYYGLVLIQFGLMFYADNSSVTKKKGCTIRPACPETYASFPSRVAFYWSTSLLYRGYKAPLQEHDVYQLKPCDTSEKVVPHFESCFEKEEEQCQQSEKDKEMQSRLRSISSRQLHDVLSSSNGCVNGSPSNSFSFPSNSYNEKDHLLSRHVLSSVKPLNRKSSQPSLARVFLRMYGWQVLASQLLKMASDLLTFVTPVLIRQLINFSQHRDSQQLWTGYVLGATFFLTAMLKTCLYQAHFHLAMGAGMRAKCAVMAAVYKKALNISPEARRETTSGEIVNLISVDCQRIQDVAQFLYMIWSLPLMTTVATYMLWGTLGAASLAPLAVLVLLVPVNVWVTYRQKTLQLQQMIIKDQRIKLTNEVLNGIKVLKLQAWEASFMSRICDVRGQELSVLRQVAWLVAATALLWKVAPTVVQLSAFTLYTYTSPSGVLDPSTAFVSLSLFAILNQPMSYVPTLIPVLIQANVSLNRVSKFLSSGDLSSAAITKDPDSEDAIKISHATFTWGASDITPTLIDINLTVPRGALVAVVGAVGAGKSSLLAAVMGEMRRMRGAVTVQSTAAYVPQEAWIQNASLRDNILFGLPYDNAKYRQVTWACGLHPDIDALPAGDRTEIGEKGVNLSGGQRQRASLARAVYASRDLYLLDDPLSAVDSHVGRHIFTEVICHQGILRGKTRVLVTHGTQWLPLCDHVVVMEGGHVLRQGTYQELIADGGVAGLVGGGASPDDDGDVTKKDLDNDVTPATTKVTLYNACQESYVNDGKSRRKSRQTSIQSITSIHSIQSMQSSEGEEGDTFKATGERLILDEKAETGKVTSGVYLQYIRAVGMLPVLCMTSLIILYQACNTYSAIWLSQWTDDPLLTNASSSSHEVTERTNMYLMVYGVLGLAQGVFYVGFSLLASLSMVHASSTLHHRLLERVLSAPMAFFDTTPLGRIINRFSRDMETIDSAMPLTIIPLYNYVFSVIGTLVTISYGTPVFLAAVLPLMFIYWQIQAFYIPAMRQLRRLESITRSPVYAFFSESVSGTASIRAYNAIERFRDEFKSRVDNNLSFYYAGIVALRWSGWCFGLVGNLIVLAAAIITVSASHLSAGLVGLSLAYASRITGSARQAVQMLSNLESNIVSVERLQEYTEIDTENNMEYDTDVDVDPYAEIGWPQAGEITFTDFKLRYRPGLDLVLKGVTCNIKPGEKVGVVGRTGAGKSSLTQALFRLVERSGGRVSIDGVDIAGVSLNRLRSRLSILPQEPVLFPGTLRSNLDPFEQHSDDVLWRALQSAHLDTFVSSLQGGLQHDPGEGGQGMSVGQRQLLCLARTLIRKARILVLDEATAQVDGETDALIQATIRREFSHATVLSIAHRLHTVVDYDKILVMDGGRVVEFDSPSVLLADRTSVFYGLAKEAGLII